MITIKSKPYSRDELIFLREELSLSREHLCSIHSNKMSCENCKVKTLCYDLEKTVKYLGDKTAE